MPKVTLKFDKTSPLWADNEQYNDVLIKSQMRYLSDVFNNDGILLIKDVCDIFRINYHGLDIDDGNIPVQTLCCYWIKPINDKIDIEVKKNDDGSYSFICNAN